MTLWLLPHGLRVGGRWESCSKASPQAGSEPFCHFFNILGIIV